MSPDATLLTENPYNKITLNIYIYSFPVVKFKEKTFKGLKILNMDAIWSGDTKCSTRID